MSEGELDGLLGEIGGACTYDNMVKMFQEKMAGDGNDSDDLIVQAFKAYDQEGKIDSKMFQHALMTWGDKMTSAEIDDIFGEFEIDEDYMIKSKEIIGLFVAVKEEPKAEEPAAVVEEAAPAEEDEGDAKKKKEEEEEGRQVNDTILLVTLLYCKRKKTWLTSLPNPTGQFYTFQNSSNNSFMLKHCSSLPGANE